MKTDPTRSNLDNQSDAEQRGGNWRWQRRQRMKPYDDESGDENEKDDKNDNGDKKGDDKDEDKDDNDDNRIENNERRQR